MTSSSLVYAMYSIEHPDLLSRPHSPSTLTGGRSSRTDISSFSEGQYAMREKKKINSSVGFS